MAENDPFGDFDPDNIVGSALNMSNQGTALDTPPASLSGMVSTLVPVAVTAGVYFLIFLILRKSHRRFYAPRSYIGSLRENERTPALPGGFLNWIVRFWKIPDSLALQTQSLDSYLYLRFIRMTVILCFVGCCITWPVLFPVNITGGGTSAQLDVLSYSNIDPKTQGNRYYAHTFVAWAYYGFVMYLIFRECVYYINLRQAFLISPFYANRVSSRTVLFTSVPDDFLEERVMRKIFGNSVKHIWINSDIKEVEKLVEERDKVAFKLEKAEVKLIKLANKERIKATKGAPEENAHPPLDAESGSVASRWVPAKKRPSHRTGPLGLIGKKVDTIDWCRSELARLIPETEAAQAKYRSGGNKKIPAVFIEFKSQAEAETAYQVLAHHTGLTMSPSYIGITPKDVVWSSLSVSWWQKLVRRYAVLAFITVMIIFWAIPVGVVGIISNIQYLETLSFLTWLKDIPDIIMGVVTGLLPSVALAILMSLVPIVMRLCAKLSGEPSYSRIELFTQNSYFAFQVIQVFLITTVTSSASAVGKQIQENPASVTTILANSLPKASNFYISYFIVQGLTIASSVISQVVGFVIFNILYRFIAGTPRALYNKWANLSAISWGSTLPVYTNITVIAITYAAIAPLVLGWATIGMALFYFAWRYNVLFVTDTQVDTRGLIYPRALKQLFVGVYLSELCLIGLFGASVAIGPLVLMIAFLVFTVLFHLSLNQALDPLLYNLPQSLMAEEEQRRAGLEATVSNEKAVANGSGSPTHSPGGQPKKGNFIIKFFKPWIYADYFTLRSYLPERDINFGLTEKLEAEAYLPSVVTSQPPLLWIPRDKAGVSAQEVAHTGKVIPITDEGCELNDKNKLEWDQDGARPPVWEEKIIY
ncbi:phosphate metabolism protein 7 [Diaporthe amygdali]|uniref:phosphate metabolism protein 7 n=1 Tax=Phomopsis amygdali TaxID=1214568 RepID=UPI0022FE41CF|nr:phosphate metabolism protein 7 [Diaporthe amygdali]KAJ0115411.1 phosphate metabolism protein 7 [Diaporthe amygdali]